MTTRITVLYFASLRDAAGMDQEIRETDAPDLAALYAEIAACHGVALPQSRLRVAVDGAFAQWDMPLRAGSSIAFIPPVSGG